MYDVAAGWALRKDVHCRNLRWTVTDTCSSPDQVWLAYATINPTVHLVRAGPLALPFFHFFLFFLYFSRVLGPPLPRAPAGRSRSVRHTEWWGGDAFAPSRVERHVCVLGPRAGRAQCAGRSLWTGLQVGCIFRA